jgi:histone H3/H4
MPFRLSIELIKNLIIIIDTQIKKEHTINKKVRLENDIYYDNLIKISDRLLFINSKLKSFQELSPTTEEISDLKFRCDQLHNKLHNINEILDPIDKKHTELIKKRDHHYYKWYLCLFCINRYKKLNFIEDLKDLNKKILKHIDLLNSEFNDLIILMADYEKQIKNLKFKFLPLRRLWISNKWDKDANQTNQRVTIFTFSQEIQSKDYHDSKYKLHSKHYENMNIFLNNMIEVDKTKDQLHAIGLGRCCGTYFLDSSLIASLTNYPSEKLEWNTLSDMVLYLSLQPLHKPTDDKITTYIINKYNDEKKLLEHCENNEDYNKHIISEHTKRQQTILAYMKELQERQEQDYKTMLRKLNLKEPLKVPVQEQLKETIQEQLKEPLKEPVQEPGKEPVQEPGKEPVQEPGKEPVQEPLKETLQEPLKETLQEPLKETLQEPLKETLQEPVQEPLKETLQEPVQESLKETLQEPVQEPLKETLEEPVQESLKETLQEPLKETLQEPLKETLQEPLKETLQEPVQESLKETLQEPGKEPGKEQLKEPLNETIQEQEKEQIVKTIIRKPKIKNTKKIKGKHR